MLSMQPSWYQIHDQNLFLHIKVKVNAKVTTILGLEHDRLKVALQAPARDNEANQTLVRFLAKYFQLTQQQIELTHGHKHCCKRIRLPLTPAVAAFIKQLNSLIL